MNTVSLSHHVESETNQGKVETPPRFSLDWHTIEIAENIGRWYVPGSVLHSGRQFRHEHRTREIFITQRKKDGAALSLIFVKSAEEKLLVNHLDCGKAVS